MVKRTLLILAALVSPLIVLAAIAMTAPGEPKPAAGTKKTSGASTLPRRLPPTERKASPDGKEVPPPLPAHHGPMTLEQARERLKRQQERLEKMTPELWEEEQRRRLQNLPAPPQPEPVEEMPEG